MLSITEAIVSYAVSAKADNSAWNKLVVEVSTMYSQSYDLDILKHQLKEAEATYKAEYNESQLPAAYRSAKSVALNAIQWGVVLRNDEGNAIGKSAVEAAIKAAKPIKEDVPKNIKQAWEDFLYNHWLSEYHDKADRDIVVAYMQGLIESYESA